MLLGLPTVTARYLGALINCFCEGLSIMTFVAYMIAVGKSLYS